MTKLSFDSLAIAAGRQHANPTTQHMSSINTNPSTALVLAAHGSDLDPRCAAPVHRHAECIRELRIFDETLAIFWKEPPHFRELYELTVAREIVLVPVMTASGYYTNTVMPRELRLDNPPNGRAVHIAQPIGELPGMTDIIIEQAVSIATENGIEPSEAHLLLIGHGTRRDPVRSGATTYRHAAEIDGRALFQGVSAGFLEQDPEVPEAFAAINSNHNEPVIIVPFLIASGGHGADDIPESLNLEPGTRVGRASGRPVFFAEAAGEHPGAVNLILQSAEELVRSLSHEQWKERCA